MRTAASDEPAAKAGSKRRHYQLNLTVGLLILGLSLMSILTSFRGSAVISNYLHYDDCGTTIRKEDQMKPGNSTRDFLSEEESRSKLPMMMNISSSAREEEARPSPSRRSTVHVLFGLSGNHPGFLSEFEVALKSVLMNSPVQSNLGIHIMADRQAYDALEEVFTRTQVRTWRTRLPIAIHTYNVEPYFQKWKTRMLKTMHQYNMKSMTRGHTMGAFFRLFAHDVVPDHVKHLLYVDPDVVFLTNVEEVWKHINPDSIFHWGAEMCSGFVLLNVEKLDEMWNIAEKLDLKAIAKELKQKPNDQLIFRAINVTYPQYVTLLPKEWDMSVADGVWRLKKTIVKHRPKVGMMHFNGGAHTKEAYYETHKFLTEPELLTTWGVALYYVRLPWTWARFVAESNLINNEGFELEVHHGNNSVVQRS